MYSLFEYSVNGMINQEAETCIPESICVRIPCSRCCIFDLGQESSLFFTYYNVQKAKMVEESAWS